MGNLAVRGLERPGDSLNEPCRSSGFFGFALFLGPCTAERAGLAVFVEQWVLARACTGKLAVFFDENFDGNPCKPNSEQRNREKDNFPFHAAKLGGSGRFIGR